MRRAVLAALLLAAAQAFLQPRRPGRSVFGPGTQRRYGPTTALAARKRSQRGKEKGSADHSSVDDWTGRRRRRIRDDVEAALDDPNWFGNRGEAYEAADDDPMAGWFDEESMVADGMGAGRARAVMARRRAIAGIGWPSASASRSRAPPELDVAEGAPSHDDDEEDGRRRTTRTRTTAVSSPTTPWRRCGGCRGNTSSSNAGRGPRRRRSAADFARPAPDTKVPGLTGAGARPSRPARSRGTPSSSSASSASSRRSTSTTSRFRQTRKRALERRGIPSDGPPCVEFTAPGSRRSGRRGARRAAARRLPASRRPDDVLLAPRDGVPGERRTRFVACWAPHDAAKNARPRRARTRCDLRSATALTAMTARTEAFWASPRRFGDLCGNQAAWVHHEI